MKLRQRLLILNGAGVVGAFISVFTLPSNTPVWVWAAASIGFLVLMNFMVLRKSKRGERETQQASSKTSTVIAAIGFLFWFLVEILPRILRR